MKQHYLNFLNFTLFLLQPEDSTASLQNCQEGYSTGKPYTQGTVKTFFWLAIAVVISLLIAKL